MPHESDKPVIIDYLSDLMKNIKFSKELAKSSGVPVITAVQKKDKFRNCYECGEVFLPDYPNEYTEIFCHKCRYEHEQTKTKQFITQVPSTRTCHQCGFAFIPKGSEILCNNCQLGMTATKVSDNEWNKALQDMKVIHKCSNCGTAFKADTPQTWTCPSCVKLFDLKYSQVADEQWKKLAKSMKHTAEVTEKFKETEIKKLYDVKIWKCKNCGKAYQAEHSLDTFCPDCKNSHSACSNCGRIFPKNIYSTVYCPSCLSDIALKAKEAGQKIKSIEELTQYCQQNKLFPNQPEPNKTQEIISPEPKPKKLFRAIDFNTKPIEDE